MRLLVFSLVLSLLSFCAAQSNNSAIFTVSGKQSTQFVFALQADRSTGDLYFHLSAPSGNSWMAVGIGSKMAGSLMFIAYQSADGNAVTISPRIGTGHSEPLYDPDIKLEKTYTGPNFGSRDKNKKIMEVDGRCHGCANWKGGGHIDFNNPFQNFIFAVGPSSPSLHSNSKQAGLTQHSWLGHFSMDMTQATVDYAANVPEGPYTYSKHASQAHDTKFTKESIPQTHGFIMCIVFILAFPSGSLLLRAWNKVRSHAIVQSLGAVLFIVAFIGGAIVSGKYNRSKHFNSAHQVIGILLLIMIIAQLTFGILHHRTWQKEQRKTREGIIHRYLGPGIILIGIINGGLGLSLAGNTSLAIPYIIVIVVVALAFAGTLVFAQRRKKRNQQYNKEVADQGVQYPQFGYSQKPPDYSEPRGQWRAPHRENARENVPLERFKSSEAVTTQASRKK